MSMCSTILRYGLAGTQVWYTYGQCNRQRESHSRASMLCKFTGNISGKNDMKYIGYILGTYQVIKMWNILRAYKVIKILETHEMIKLWNILEIYEVIKIWNVWRNKDMQYNLWKMYIILDGTDTKGKYERTENKKKTNTKNSYRFHIFFL